MISGGYSSRFDTTPVNNGSANGPIGSAPPRINLIKRNNPGTIRPGWGTMPLHMNPYPPQPMPLLPPPYVFLVLVSKGSWSCGAW